MTNSGNYFQAIQPGTPTGPYAEQRTIADMIQNMTQVSFTADEAEQHREQLTRANRYLRTADAHRVRRFTNLKSPF